ncbi:MAG: WD40 repeat domain-containing protein [Anaerolineaceae bacterium]
MCCRLIILFLIVSQITACSTMVPNSSSSGTPVSESILEFTSTIFPEHTLTPTTMKSQTASPIATFTNTPTPTPTLSLPVNLAQLFPKPSIPLSLGNIHKVQEIAYYGSPLLLGYKITPDNKMLFVVTTSGINVFDLATNQLLNYFDAYICRGRFLECATDKALSVSYDGSRFAILSNDSIQVWTRQDGLIMDLLLEGLTGPYDSAEISQDGKLLATDNDGVIKIYDIETKQTVADLPGLPGNRFRFSPDGLWFVEWRERSGTIWKVADWSKHRDIVLAKNQVIKGFSPNGQIIVLQDNEYFTFFQIAEWRLKRQLAVHQDKSKQTKGIYFSPSGGIFAFWESKFNISDLTSQDWIRAYDLSTGEIIKEQKLPDTLYSFSITDEGKISIFQISEEICDFLNIEPCVEYYNSWWKAQFRYVEDPTTFYLWQWNHGSQSMLNTIRPGDTITRVELLGPAFLDGKGHSIVFQEGGVIDTYEVIRKLDKNSIVIGEFRSKAQSLVPYWLSPNEKYLLLNTMTQLSGLSFSVTNELWDIQSKTLIKKWSEFDINYDSSPDGKLLAINVGEQLFFFNLETGQAINTVGLKQREECGSLTFTIDQQLICATPSQKPLTFFWPGRFYSIFRFDPVTKKRISLITDIPQTDYYLEAIALSLDETMLAVGLADGKIRVYDLLNGQEIYSWQAHNGNITDLKFDKSGTFLVSQAIGSQNYGDGFVRIWGIRP